MNTVTHEQFISAVRDAAIIYASHGIRNKWLKNGLPSLSGQQLSCVARAKMLYGRGHAGLRGVTQYGAWKNGQTDELIEICAASEENWIQLAGTTIHELAHCATGMGHGHNKAWKQACHALGLRRVFAAGTTYMLANFAPELRFALAQMPKPADGTPQINGIDASGLPTLAHRPCGAGIGVRGGISRGPGSGSRLRKWMCGHGQIIRASTDHLQATCDVCRSSFQLV